MERRRIGSLEVSVFGLGSAAFGMRADYPTAKRAVEAALSVGINVFETADMYGGGQAEEFLGRALGSRRDEAVIATKFGYAPLTDLTQLTFLGASANVIREAVDGSLRRLQTDYIDLYSQHAPDPGVDVSETLGALDELVKVGKVREIGTSRFSAAQIEHADEVARATGKTRFTATTAKMSLVARGALADLVPAARRLDIAFVPFSPIGSGLLRDGGPREAPTSAGQSVVASRMAAQLYTLENFRLIAELERVAEERERTLSELALAWLIAQPGVTTVITGSTNPENIAANARVAENPLSTEELAEVDGIVAAIEATEMSTQQ
jgi:aryl-alcohol dehydrogenase-like predicted oxidoreductase